MLALARGTLSRLRMGLGDNDEKLDSKKKKTI